MDTKQIMMVAMIAAALQGCGMVVEKESEVKPITGTWVNFAYKDARNKYTNPETLDMASPELWEAKVREWKKIGMEYLVLMEVANEGKSYYPSEVMEPIYDISGPSPVEAILDEAARHDMKVFVSTGWAKDQDDDLREEWVRERQKLIMTELAGLYGNKAAFHGWYLPVEDCITPVFPEHAVDAVNTLVAQSQALTPGKKTLISPYGLVGADFNDPRFAENISKLKVDIIAYQDEIGCKREEFPLVRLEQNWKQLRKIHDACGIQLWANCETFTWEGNTNDRASALIPAAFSRLLAQQIAASEGGVDRIISFMFDGIIEDPSSRWKLGQPETSEKLYAEYSDWKEGSKYWRMMELALAGSLIGDQAPEMATQGQERLLFDGEIAGTSTSDPRWLNLPAGRTEITMDLGKERKVGELLVRFLDYAVASILPPESVLILTSSDGETFKPCAEQSFQAPGNNRHDAWIDGVLIQCDVDARFLRLSFETETPVFIDEIFLNPREGTRR